jgi:hypothetical protein
MPYDSAGFKWLMLRPERTKEDVCVDYGACWHWQRPSFSPVMPRTLAAFGPRDKARWQPGALFPMPAGFNDSLRWMKANSRQSSPPPAETGNIDRKL